MTISQELEDAYRWHRQISQRPRPWPTCNASTAINCARRDVANGKHRYPSPIKPYGAVSWSKEKIGNLPFPKYSHTVGHVQDIEGAGLRFVGRVIPETGRNGIWDTRGDCGWYTDPSGDVFRDGTGLAWGVVYQLPARDGKARFVAGYVLGGDSDDLPTIDFSEIFEEGCRGGYSDSPCDYDAAHTAAYASDSMAQHAAEQEREYQTAWQAGNRYADTVADIGTEREHVKGLLAERKAARSIDADGFKAICATIRKEIRHSLANIEAMRNRRDELKSGDHDSLIFYPGDSDLRAAFNDGAGSTVLA